MNSYGTKFRLSIFGESHGPLIGVVLDGVPAGMPLSREDFLADLDRRRSGAKGSTPRKESDLPEIVSGVCDGHTTGAPLTIVFRNSNTRSGDYSDFRATPVRAMPISWRNGNTVPSTICGAAAIFRGG